MWGPEKVDEFDRFYKDVRTRLLVLTYCLTGDLSSSRAAVRESLVAAWHHWRKVSRLEDPEAWVRVRACAQAQRRHTAKLWHREKGLDPDVKATLDALGKLPIGQRRVLLLAELTTASLTEIAREAGLPRTDAEAALQKGSAQLAMLRAVPTTSIRTLFEPVRAHLEDTRWPRSTIIRRAGSTRRRTHTVVGVVATVAALVGTGVLVSDGSPVRPTLSGERVEAVQDNPTGSRADPEPVEVPADAMVTAKRLGRAAQDETWRVASTDHNTTGDGTVMPCQQDRYADPRGVAALVRTFESVSRHDPATAAQATQISASPRAARRGYATTVRWFAGCSEDRAQLLTSRAVTGVGDQAVLLVLRTWDHPASTVVAGVARTGRLVTTTVTRTPVGHEPSLGASSRLLADGVRGVCGLPGATMCATQPQLRTAPPVPVATMPAMLAEVDLPPVSGVTRPWVGTQPRQARTNAAATGCDRADFSGRAVSNDATRTFLVPGARLPAQFGLTETVGSLREARAKAFVAEVRDRLARCHDKQMGTDVTRLRQVTTGRRELSVWNVRTEISDHASVTFLMGIVRDGTSVAQVGFVPAPDVTMTHDAFLALVQRALDRLHAMPPPRRG
jgi:DNA-directed RNA polymerase specialized sigma24 family protein